MHVSPRAGMRLEGLALGAEFLGQGPFNIPSALLSHFMSIVDRFDADRKLLPALYARVTTLGQLTVSMPPDHPARERMGELYSGLVARYDDLRSRAADLQATVADTLQKMHGLRLVAAPVVVARVTGLVGPWVMDFEGLDRAVVGTGRLIEKLAREAMTPADVDRIIAEAARRGGDPEHPFSWRELVHDIPRAVFWLGAGLLLLFAAPRLGGGLGAGLGRIAGGLG